MCASGVRRVQNVLCMHVSSSRFSLPPFHSPAFYGLRAVEPDLRDGMKWKKGYMKQRITQYTAMNE